MEVVESFACCSKNSYEVPTRVHVLVITLLSSPEMSDAIYGPGTMEGYDISECIANYICVEEILVPKVPWNQYRKYLIKKVAKELVVPEINL